MSFYRIATPWNPGYAIPKYVAAEPPGRGTFTTEWTPRGTIQQLIPDSLSGLGALGDSTIGGDPTIGAGAEDPFLKYGKTSAAAVFKAVNSVAPKYRDITLKAILQEIDPSLYGKVKANPTQANLANLMATGIAREIVELGAGKRSPRKARQVMHSRAAKPGYRPTDGWFDKYIVNPIKKYNPVSLSLDVGEDILKKATSALKTVGGAACALSQNPLGVAAASGAAAAAGQPPQTGAAGMAATAAICASGQPAPTPTIVPVMPGWVLPAAIGGGALLLIVLLKK